ncbi:MAG: DUF2480 family protein [Balneolaceae bacterium]|nr:MAG: DUF2480 family protein [Balneolaceae bacterium]
MAEIINKVKQSRLITIDLEKMLPENSVIEELDLSQFLFQGLILRELEYRKYLEEFNWEQFEGSYLATHCSTDAIIPKWAYMLVVQHSSGFAREVFFGKKEDALSELYERIFSKVDWKEYSSKYVLLKGCSKIDLPPSVYLNATKKLLPFVGKLMYGEACSNVPIYRKK